MDKFIVSARKYRPQEFNTVVGQAHITTTLKNAIKNNQLAHAFLFCGPRGVGKTTCARILAKTINCTNLQPSGEACDVCNSCKSFNDGASFNVHELDAASNNSVEDIRVLVEQVRFTPQAGKYKVYIVDEVHMLSSSAFNAFLKTLEEPPAHAIFILATTEKHKILPTILSRCQIFDFKRITTNDTVEHLQEIVDKENIKTDKASLQIIAQKSEGCMRDALSILDKIVSFSNGEVNYQNTLEHLNILDYDYFFKLLNSLMQQDMSAALLLYDEVNKKGFEGDLVLNGFAECIRNILVCKDAKAAALLDVVEGLQEQYYNLAKTTNTGFLISTLNVLNEAELNYKMARNKRLHVELVLIKLCFLQQAIDLSVQDNNIVKKKRVDTPQAIKFKPIASIQIKQNSLTEATAKLFIQTNDKPVVKAEKITPKSDESLVQEPVMPIATSSSLIPKNNGDGKKQLLQLLKDKVGQKAAIEEVKESFPLSEEKLMQHWQEYVEIMEKEGGKLSTISTFKMAKLVIENEVKFTITVNALTQQKFIEQEKMMLASHIQTSFNNRAIQFFIEINDSQMPEIPKQQMLNNRDKFEIMAQQYPLLREFKDKLKLDIDF
jgi:DNA polymerase-3 subunit gamma/tau